MDHKSVPSGTEQFPGNVLRALTNRKTGKQCAAFGVIPCPAVDTAVPFV